MQTSVSASADIVNMARGPRGSLGVGGLGGSGAPTGSSVTIATSAPHRQGAPASVPLIHDNMTFDARQATRLRDIEKRMESEMKRKKRNFEREVDQMREEFLHLIPSDKVWGSDELIVDPFVLRRRGSTDILNPRKLKTMFYTASPEAERKFKIRFDLSRFDPQTVQVCADNERITIKAVKLDSEAQSSCASVGELSSCRATDVNRQAAVSNHVSRSTGKEYYRKIEKPKEVDHTKLRSRLSSDGILLIQAPLIAESPKIKSGSHSTHRAGTSPSHSFHSAVHGAETRSKSPPMCGSSSSTELTPSAMKLGVPIFREESGGVRRMHLAVDVGAAFKPKEITVQAIKDNRILIKAKHEERTTERLCKNKYSKEFELPEKIDTHSLRGGLCGDGRLVVGAFVKGHGAGGEWEQGTPHHHVFIEQLDHSSDAVPCNVLNLASFPPKMSSSASAACILTNSASHEQKTS